MDVLVVILIIAAGIALAFALASRCPRCREFLALQFTEAERSTNRLGVPVNQREVICKRCGYRFWKDCRQGDSSPGNGGP